VTKRYSLIQIGSNLVQILFLDQLTIAHKGHNFCVINVKLTTLGGAKNCVF
jgi:hypothetical protein